LKRTDEEFGKESYDLAIHAKIFAKERRTA